MGYEVKMGKLLTKILRASQDRVIGIVNAISNPIKEAQDYDTRNNVPCTELRWITSLDL